MSIQGQTYKTKYIIDKADSILKFRVGDALYQYFTYNTNSYYKYRGFNNKSHGQALIKSKKTKGKFIKANVRFWFDYSLIKGIYGIAHLNFDSNLNLIDSLTLDFIPDFLWNNKKCNFISSDTALKIAIDSIKEKGLFEIKPFLHFDSKHRRYVYEINNILKQKKGEINYIEYTESLIEVIRVDAISKEILYHSINWSDPDFGF